MPSVVRTRAFLSLPLSAAEPPREQEKDQKDNADSNAGADGKRGARRNNIDPFIK
jgi:hypothetical protein